MTASTFDLESQVTGTDVELTLHGSLVLENGAELWNRLRDGVPGEAKSCRMNLAPVQDTDGAGISLLLAFRAGLLERGMSFEFVGADSTMADLLDLYGCPSGFPCAKPAPTRTAMLDQIGRASVQMITHFQETLAFVGGVLVSGARALREPRTVHWKDVGRFLEKAGADAVPIVALINFLVGLIMGLQAAVQLERFGASVFVADLVALSVTRELGPLMTAIILAGRSGAAFAAELGTMRVSEEVDALRTMSLDPQRFLVFPRVLSVMIAMPLLVLMADVVGCLGGLFVATKVLDLAPVVYFQQLQQAVGVGDVVGGMVKGMVFAAAIALIACQRGLTARGGAAGVGNSTTSAVVTILFALVILDAVFTALYNFLGI